MTWSRHMLLVTLGRLAVLGVILIGTEIGVRSGFLSPLFFSSPTQIFHVLGLQLANGTLLGNIGITALETLLGLAVGSLLGMSIGLVLPQLRILSQVLTAFR